MNSQSIYIGQTLTIPIKLIIKGWLLCCADQQFFSPFAAPDFLNDGTENAKYIH